MSICRTVRLCNIPGSGTPFSSVSVTFLERAGPLRIDDSDDLGALPGAEASVGPLSGTESLGAFEGSAGKESIG